MHFIFLHKKNWSGNLASNNKNSIQPTWRALASDRNRKRFNTNSGQLHKKVTARKVKCQTKTFNFLTWYNSVKSSRNIFWSSFQELSFFETRIKILKDGIFLWCFLCVLYFACFVPYAEFLHFILHLLKHLERIRHYNVEMRPQE